MSPELAAELADIAGEDARQAVIDAVIERNAANRKGKVLREILGKAVAAGVVGMLVFFYNAGSTYAMEKIAKPVDSLYIVFTRLRALWQTAREALRPNMGLCSPIPQPQTCATRAPVWVPVVRQKNVSGCASRRELRHTRREVLRADLQASHLTGAAG